VSKPVRIQRKRAKGWRAPEGAVYVGRGCGLPWGNPWKVEAAIEAGYSDGHKMAAYAFGRWLKGDPSFKRAELDPERDWILANIESLRGKTLMCWCPPDRACHADVLLELANAPPPGTEG
jgi:hypothetical protein